MDYGLDMGGATVKTLSKGLEARHPE
jgi:hypothetical protein